jgi:hypothetical protein
VLAFDAVDDPAAPIDDLAYIRAPELWNYAAALGEVGQAANSSEGRLGPVLSRLRCVKGDELGRLDDTLDRQLERNSVTGLMSSLRLGRGIGTV